MNRVVRALGRRNALIAALGVVVVAGGSGVGIYLQARAHPSLQQSATRNVSAAPTAVPVGVKTVGAGRLARTPHSAFGARWSTGAHSWATRKP